MLKSKWRVRGNVCVSLVPDANVKVSLTLYHTSVWFCHLQKINFVPTWPMKKCKHTPRLQKTPSLVCLQREVRAMDRIIIGSHQIKITLDQHWVRLGHIDWMCTNPTTIPFGDLISEVGGRLPPYIEWSAVFRCTIAHIEYLCRDIHHIQKPGETKLWESISFDVTLPLNLIYFLSN